MVVVGQEAAGEVERERVRVAVDVAAAQPQRAGEQLRLLERRPARRRVGQRRRDEPEVGQDVVQRHRRDLRVQPLVVEEDLEGKDGMRWDPGVKPLRGEATGS